jgi:hypothetical protein
VCAQGGDMARWPPDPRRGGGGRRFLGGLGSRSLHWPIVLALSHLCTPLVGGLSIQTGRQRPRTTGSTCQAQDEACQ